MYIQWLWCEKYYNVTTYINTKNYELIPLTNTFFHKLHIFIKEKNPM